MRRELICLGTLLSLLIGIPYARGDISDELVGYWNFDEGTISGTAVADSSGKENHGISVGSPTPVPGKVGTGALAFGGSKYIIIDRVADDIRGAADITLNGWVKTATTTRTYWIACNTATGGNVVMFAIDGPMGGISYIYDGGTSTREIHSLNPVNDNQWHMLTYVKSGSVGTHYVDGVEQGTHTVSYASFRSDDLWSMGQEWDSANPSNFFSDAGQLDEVAIWRRALTMAEVVKIYNAGNGMSLLRGPVASSPNPADEFMDVPRDVTLSWEPGEFAAPTNGHKVYFGQSFNDVNDATGGIAQDANSYTPAQRLDFNTTYYWRIDEVNAPPTSQIEFKGGVWSFTTEPFAYAIENITATASSVHQADMGPENTINGSGLDADDLHSIEPADMWLSGDEPNGAWIEYEFDKVYKLHQMWVWNSNGMMESVLGFGLKDVTIEYSTNGTIYTTLGTTHEFARALGAVDYAHNTTIDFGSVTAKYVRLTANSNWGGILDQYGLSEVRFLHIPVFAKEPSPDSGTTDVAVDVTLGFRAGREADKHDVYFSSDEQAVIDGNAPVTTVTETNYGPLSLDLGTTYYWKINEVNEAETPTTWQGDIWNFSTREFFVVDGFEDYNDYPPDEIWSTWVDGYGVPANGATVGYPNPD
ncbi:MAG: discoidin domain-containing protein, partial [Planctomycetes bacterium]|nr:discoidin domain-containing protein [Planctomycetota bacterium]